ncbi:hypothetical protein [Bacillus sp. ME78]|uniref:hypothetical protein n=1 Tax=Bacillus sp. ME78 TaxID=2744261 RepID=UPI002174D9DE|nr:hypothetical protein [Bacillus sp. ME78]
MDSNTKRIYKKRMIEQTILFSLIQLVPLLFVTGIIYVAMEISNSKWQRWLSYEGIFTILFLIIRFPVFQMKDQPHFLYTAVYLSSILSPISKEIFEEYKTRNLMGR